MSFITQLNHLTTLCHERGHHLKMCYQIVNKNYSCVGNTFILHTNLTKKKDSILKYYIMQSKKSLTWINNIFQAREI